MQKKNINIEMNIADTIMERPIGFKIGNRRFFLYRPTLGKTYLLVRLIKELDANIDLLSVNPYIEALRLCKEKRNIVCRIIAYHSLNSKAKVLNEGIVSARQKLFDEKLDDEELAQILVVVSTWDETESYIHYLGLDKERSMKEKIAKYKQDGNEISFGGLSSYGTLIDFACNRYGWSMDYVVWGISYANLKMLIADSITSIHLTKEEQQELHISNDREVISGDDPKNIEKIMSMKWD